MNLSLPKSARSYCAASPEKHLPGFSGNRSENLFSSSAQVTSGSLNDSSVIRSVVTDALKQSALSRVQVAEEMSRLTGTNVTERQLNNFSSNARDDYRFPSELERAFCAATGDHRLLICRAELAGLQVIDEEGAALMELGREYLRQKRASAAVASLEVKLMGVVL